MTLSLFHDPEHTIKSWKAVTLQTFGYYPGIVYLCSVQDWLQRMYKKYNVSKTHFIKQFHPGINKVFLNIESWNSFLLVFYFIVTEQFGSSFV